MCVYTFNYFATNYYTTASSLSTCMNEWKKLTRQTFLQTGMLYLDKYLENINSAFNKKVNKCVLSYYKSNN